MQKEPKQCWPPESRNTTVPFPPGGGPVTACSDLAVVPDGSQLPTAAGARISVWEVKVTHAALTAVE